MDVLQLMDQHHLIAVDAVMGSGKTTSMIQFVLQHPEFHYLFVTPYLDEVDRIITSTGEEFFQPFDWGEGKLPEVHEMLRAGQNIATTHALLQRSTDETVELVRQGQYILILDEALGCVQQFNKLTKNPISTEDFYKILLDKNLIEVFYEKDHPECGLITWIGGDVEGTLYGDIARMANSHRLYCIGYEPEQRGKEVILLCEYPPDIFRACKNVFYMSYLHRKSVMDAYFATNGMESYLVSADMTDDGQAILCEYNQAKMKPRMFAELIDIHFDYVPKKKQLNKIGDEDYSLSFGNYDGMTNAIAKKLQDNLVYYFRYICQTTAEHVMYTVPLERAIPPENAPDDLFMIRPPSFSFVKTYNEYRKEIVEQNAQLEDWKTERLKLLKFLELDILDDGGRKRLLELQKLCRQRALEEKDYMTFVVHNARATNKFSSRTKLAYCINRFLQPEVKILYCNRGFVIDENQWALGEMIQWIWRSAIRNGQPIQLYVPSKRMRDLLLEWLGVDENFYRLKHGFRKKRLPKSKKLTSNTDAPKRKRGRPPKNKPTAIEEDINESAH